MGISEPCWLGVAAMGGWPRPGSPPAGGSLSVSGGVGCRSGVGWVEWMAGWVGGSCVWCACGVDVVGV
eukprot:3107005-Prorocentrum_lima.AAC.1